MSTFPIAAVPVDVKFCQDCKERGVNVAAERLLPSGRKLCDAHWRARAGMPALKPEPAFAGRLEKIRSIQSEKSEEKKMPQGNGIDWEAVRRYRAAGMSAAAASEKHGCHVSAVYAHEKKNGNGGKPAGGGQKAPKPKSAKVVTRGLGLESLGGTSISAIVAHLRAQRDALTSAIESLEKLEA